MRWIPVVAVRSVVQGGHSLGPRGLGRRHGVLLHLGIVRIQIGYAAKGRVLPLEGQLGLGRGGQQCVLGRFRRSSCWRRCGWTCRTLRLIGTAVEAGITMISANAGTCGRREWRSMRLVIVVGWLHLHHGATRRGSLVRIRMWMVRMIFTPWPAREESLISAAGIGVGRRSRSMRLVMRMEVLRQGGVAVPHTGVHVLLMIRIVVKASALGISRVEFFPAAVVIVVIARIRHLAKALVVVAEIENRLVVLEIGKVIRRNLGRQELLRLLVVCRRGDITIAVVPLPTRSDRRRAVQPGSLRAGGTCRGGVERLAEFL